MCGSVAMLATPRVAGAQQQPGKVYRIGFLGPSSATAVSRFTESFRQGLRELWWVEGQNIVIEHRFAEGQFDRLPATTMYREMDMRFWLDQAEAEMRELA